MDAYAPSNGTPAQFIVSPVLNGGQVVGYIAMQFNNEQITDLVNSPAGMGSSGESYLVGSDYKMRSQSRLDTNNTVLSRTVQTKGTQDVLREGQNYREKTDIYPDYRGVRVAAFNRVIKVNDQVNWALISEIDESELLAPVMALRNEILLLVFISVVIIAGLGVFFSGQITNPILRTSQSLKEISEGEGDLTQRLEVLSKDETGELSERFNMFINQVETIVSDVKNIAGAVSQASNEIDKGNSDLAQRTQEQASSVEETSASMEEMASTVQKNAENSQQTNALAKEAAANSEKGDKIAEAAVVAMQGINAASKKIADIINVIDEIAFQTNLLALNAAVEAARAGEQGRGFAVVAVEVRNLAQRSASAAKEIKDLIQDSVQKIENGVNLVNQTGVSFKDILKSIASVRDISSEVAAASEEQTQGIGQVNQALTQVDQVTQQNSSLVEEMSATSSGLNAQANQLIEMLSRFKVRNTIPSQPTVSGSHKAIIHKAATAEPLIIAGRAPKNTTHSTTEFQSF
jgi:methyl-accepting chemotaxis protein